MLKSYNKTGESIEGKTRRLVKECSTLIKFTDGDLDSWDEDKMTLAMSKTNIWKRNSSFLSCFGLLLNLVLLIKII